MTFDQYFSLLRLMGYDWCKKHIPRSARQWLKETEQAQQAQEQNKPQ